MKAMELRELAGIEQAPLRLVSRPDPLPGPGEVRLRVHCCAICRTDLHVIEGELPRMHLPIVPGHQVVGTVDRVGPGCNLLRPGDRVGVAWLRHTCGACPFCTSGRENLCPAQRFTGYHADGGYAELACAPEAYTYRIPESFSDLEAAPLLCAGIVGYRALQRSRVPPGGRLALVGFGSSAHVVMQIALGRGCEVYVVTRGAQHRELARQMGAKWVGAEPAQLPVRVDSTILFAPAGGLVPPLLERLERGGTLALAGIYLSDVPTLNYEAQLFYERDVRSVTANTRADGRELLAEAAALRLRPHVSTYPLADANRALLDLKADRINGTGVLVVET